MIAAHDDLRFEGPAGLPAPNTHTTQRSGQERSRPSAGRTSRATLDRENGVTESHGTGTPPRLEIVENTEIRKQKKRRPSVG